MANFQELTIGSVITFMMRDTRERYKGAVCELNPSGRVGIKNISGWKDEKCELTSEGIRYFPRGDIVVIKITEIANIANTDQDGNNNNLDDGSSSKSAEGKMGSLRLNPHSK